MKRLLLITYYFPPCGGAAVQRWLRLLPLLADSGYEITVLTTQDGDYPSRDETLLEKIPPGVKVIRTKTPVFGNLWRIITGQKEPLPYGSLDSSESTSIAKKLMYWVRLNLIYPDARVIWNHIAITTAMQLCRENRFDWVITTGPPHSTHLIGLYLKKHIKIKWLADFRDPWTQIYYLKSNQQNRLVTKLNYRLEKQVLSHADVNLVVSNAIANQLPDGMKKVLYNGFDKEQFLDTIYTKTDKFRIKYIGQITQGQDINQLLAFVSAQLAKHNIEDVSFEFIGTTGINLPEVGMPVTVKSYMAHTQAINEMVNSELLVLIINNYADNQGMLTTKLFEYIGAGTPILCFGPLDGEAAAIIHQAQAGLVSPEFNAEVWSFIDSLYQKWQAGITIKNDHDVSQWSVQQQIRELIDILA